MGLNPLVEPAGGLSQGPYDWRVTIGTAAHDLASAMATA